MQRRNILILAAAIPLVALTASFIAVIALRDLDTADKIASVVGAIAGCVALALTMALAVVEHSASRGRKARTGGAPRVPRAVRAALHQVRTYWAVTWARRTVVAVLALVLLVPFIIVGRAVLGDGDGPVEQTAAPPPSCASPDATLVIASSADKSALLVDVAEEYGPRMFDGLCLDVQVDEQNSGKAMEALVRTWADTDGRRPDVWSPASSEWLTIARQRAAGSTNATVLPPRAPGTFVSTPLVIAMPEPMAQALGWPTRTDIGWQELAALSTSPDGWARYGHPEWGAFRLGKTNPKYSTSGLNATVAAFSAYRAAARPGQDPASPLTAADVVDSRAQAFVQDIERSIVHYGPTTLDFLRNLRLADDQGKALAYVSAVTIEESSMLAYDAGYVTGTFATSREAPPQTRLVAVYPDEGTIDSDHPYIELSWPDTTSAKREAADAFLDHLRSAPVQRRFQDVGFRDREGRPGPLATPANGVGGGRESKRLTLPGAAVLDDVLTAWTAVRKPANVLLVVDTSGSMNERQPQCAPERRNAEGQCPTKLELLKSASEPIADGFTDADHVGLWRFSLDLDGDRDYRELLPLTQVDESGRKDLVDGINGLTTDTDTGLFDTISAAVSTTAANRDPNAINAVVVLTDGRDSNRGMTKDALLEQLAAQPDDARVRVFTIAYGVGSDQDDNGRSVLQQIAEASGAAKYDARDPYRITEELVAGIVSNF